jgi:hypothetical protein
VRKRYRALGVALVLLTGTALAYVLNGRQLYHDYQREYATYQFTPNGPCGALIAWSPPPTLFVGLYANQSRLLNLRYSSPTPQTLHITLSIPDVTQEESLEVQAAPAFQSRDFRPPLLGASTLDAVLGAGELRAEIHLSVHGAGGECDVTKPVLVKSRQWMHWYDPTTGKNNIPYLAGWVTPDAPAIRSLIGRAANRLAQQPATYPAISALVGYGDGTISPQAVHSQVNAIFDTLQQDYQVRYAEDNVPFNADAVQRIQLPSDVLENKYPTGMCVETTAILASAVERLGMRPFIVIVPGHAFLGVALGPNDDAPVTYWETSDLNGVSGAQANIHGDNEYADAFAQGHVLAVVNIQAERQQGIMPIE